MIRKEEMMLIEAGVDRAKWMSKLDERSNSGAHMNSESFVMDSGSYMEGVGEPADGNAVESMDVNWGSVDKNQGM